MRGGEPSAVAEFLAQYPDQEKNVETRAVRECESGGVWYGLVLALGLIPTASASALVVLRKLLDRHYLVPWNRLNGAQMGSIIDYLSNQNALTEIAQLSPHLNDKEFLALPLDLSHPAFPDFLKVLLERKQPISHIISQMLEMIANEVQRLLPSTHSSSNPVLQRYALIAEMLLSAGHSRGALRMLAILGLASVRPSEVSLRQIAASLLDLREDALVYASNLLWRFPSRSWISNLKDVWLSIEEDLRFDPDEDSPETIDPFLDAAANAVAVALGACAACDLSYNDFADDIKLNEKEPNAIEQYNRSVTEYNDLMREYLDLFLLSERRVTIVERLKILKPQLENQRHDLQQRFKDKHSAGYLLLQFLRASQIYPVSARQGAAWGLHLLRTRGHLNEATKNELFVALCEVSDGKNDERFRERHIRLLPESNVLELTDALRNGLQWMADIIEGDYATSTDSAGVIGRADEYPRLQETVSLMCEMLPGALNFLQRYPLRLMPLTYHKRILGQYLKSGGALVYWTRYTPPKNVGPVHRRYIAVEDRSRPNSMGIYYKLFRHPVLVLPIIYHEFMHYGGPAGDPSRGIANETEVLLRELIFARYLIGRLAPASDHELPAFESSLVQEIKHTELESLQWQLVHDFSDDLVLANINHRIIELYGEQLSKTEVEDQLAQRMTQENLGIRLQNMLLNWDPAITWSELGTPQTRAATKQYREMLRRLWRRSHRVSPKKRDNLLQSEPCASQIRAWEQYVSRQNALQQLVPPALADLYLTDEILWLIVQRFDLGRTVGHEAYWPELH